MVVLEYIGYALLALLAIALASVVIRLFASVRYAANREAVELNILQTRLEAARIARERATASAAP